MLRRLSKGQLLLLATAYVLSIGLWMHQITAAPVEGDALGNLIPAINLQHHGVLSLETSDPLTPTMYREPLPMLVTAAMVAAADAVYGKAELPAYYSGERAHLLKLQNLFWLTLLCGAAFVVTFQFTRSFWLALTTSVLSYAIFIYPALRFSGVDSLHTDIAAAGILILASWCYAGAVAGRGLRWFAAAGALFGLLALVKGAALYVFAGLLFAVGGFALLVHRSARMRSAAAGAAVMLLAFGVLVSPWMLRNWVQFDTFAIAERGGLALYHRALFNEVSPIEYRGLFYVWAPGPIRNAMGRALGFSPADLEQGGALSRLNSAAHWAENLRAEQAGRPQDATSIMAEGRAEREKARMQFSEAGLGQRANVAADALLRERAIRKILDNPGGAFAVSVAALWRGAFLIAPLLAWVTFESLRRSRLDLLALSLPASGLVLFYAAFSHFEARYGVVMTPVVLVAAAAAASNTGLRARRASPAGGVATGWPKVLGRSMAGRTAGR